jgi:hypothetical protein
MTRLLFLFAILGHGFAACMPDKVQSSGAIYRICMPDPGKWNGDLVIYAHGYVAFNEPIRIPEDQLTLPDGTSLPALINGLGYAFAVSSYSVNGLAVLQGIQDSAELAAIFRTTISPPRRVFLVGPSEGGIVTALSIERLSDIYQGGVAACGPIGNFRQQINYLGDFRVLFDYFFPGVIPGSVERIPDEVIRDWDSIYVPKIKSAIKANPVATAQLINTSNAAAGFLGSNVEETVVDVLWYSTFTTNDAVAKLGGQPFDNTRKRYSGSSNDFLLNLLVKRIAADPAALNTIASHYESTGNLTRPLVTLHTTGDQIIPYWHEALYSLKTLSTGSAAQRTHYPVFRYGHCNFNALEALIAFGTMVLKATGETLSSTAANLLPLDQRAGFTAQARAAGILR